MPLLGYINLLNTQAPGFSHFCEKEDVDEDNYNKPSDTDTQHDY